MGPWPMAGVSQQSAYGALAWAGASQQAGLLDYGGVAATPGVGMAAGGRQTQARPTPLDPRPGP